ncbi:unnamed protein product, partial [Strongylus vulgaris]
CVGVVVDRQSRNGPNPASSFGTLPRERLNTHKPLQPNLSVSSPNLNELDVICTKKIGTLQRKDAIRKKRQVMVHNDNEHERGVQFPDSDGLFVVRLYLFARSFHLRLLYFLYKASCSLCVV